MSRHVARFVRVYGFVLAGAVMAAGSLAARQEPRQPTSALLVILDVSGSMKESVEGGVKQELASKGLLQTLDSLPGDTVVSLQLLGQGSLMADECAATATAVQFAPFDRTSWEDALGTIRWDGATPLVHTMQTALRDLREVNAARREILIIGDGEETCGNDPVGVARAEAGDIPIHTISLGEQVSHQLAGIALVTGGTYTRAFDETSFATATASAIPEAPLDLGNPGGSRPSGSAGTSGSRVDVIVDVSNSMWGQIGGRPKIDLAREALRGALADLPADVAVGLRAYGHRVSVDDKDAGCLDTEQMLAPAGGNGAAIVRIVDALTPRGQTPIARSLQEAADDLPAGGGGSSILLVSDGVESCGGDPVAVIADLRAAGVNVVLHTVGLGVSEGEAAALRDLAEAGGGRYFDAPTASELLTGVDTVVRSSSAFVMDAMAGTAFPQNVQRVAGGQMVAESELLELGTYSFTEHLVREERYFAVAGQPGEMITLSGMVCALEIGRTRDGVTTFMGNPNMMMARGVDAGGDDVRRTSLLVRGDMGEWVETRLPVGTDGLARFRIGRTQGAVHRDMIFRLTR